MTFANQLHCNVNEVVQKFVHSAHEALEIQPYYELRTKRSNIQYLLSYRLREYILKR